MVPNVAAYSAAILAANSHHCSGGGIEIHPWTAPILIGYFIGLITAVLLRLRT